MNHTAFAAITVTTSLLPALDQAGEESASPVKKDVSQFAIEEGGDIMLHHDTLKGCLKNWKHPVLGLVAMLLSLTVFSQGPERTSEDQVVRFSETTSIRSVDGGHSWQLASGTLEQVPYWAQTWLENEVVQGNTVWSPRSVGLGLESGGVLHRPAGEKAWRLESSVLNELPYWAQGWLENPPTERPVLQDLVPVESMCRGDKPMQHAQTVQIGPDLSVRSFDGGMTWAMAEGNREDLPDWVEAWLEQPQVEVQPAKEFEFGNALIRSVDGGMTWTQVKGSMDDLPEWVRPWVGGAYPGSSAAVAASAAEAASPKGFSLFPNPTRNSASLRFELEREQEVRVLLFDLQGKLIREVQNGRLPAGQTELQFSVADLAVGPYFLQFIAEDQQERIRLVRSH